MLGRPFYAFVDSDYAERGDCGDFDYRINLPNGNDYDSVVLLQGSFPKSYYVVRDGFNTLTLTETSGSVTITIQKGNYSMAAFRATLQNELNAQSPGGYTYSVAMPSFNNTVNSGKFTYTVSGNAADQPIFSFPISTLLYKQMGFVYNSTNAFVGNTLESTNVCNFNTVSGLLVKSDIVDGSNMATAVGTNVLQEVLAYNTYDFSNIGFSNPAPEYSAKRLKPGTSNIMNFKISDLDDNILDFNGQSCNFSLCFFKRDNSSELQIRDMKMRYLRELLGSPEQSTPAQS